MQNLEKLKDAFAEALMLERASVTDALAYGDHKWDSVAHMILISALEAKFGLMLDTDDVIALSSFTKAREILTRCGVDFNA